MSTNQIGNLEAGIMKTTNPALSNDVDFFPGARLRSGFGHMINSDLGAGRPQGRKPDMGRALQHLLLDRPGFRRRRRDLDRNVWSGRALQDAWSAMADGVTISLIQINDCQSNEIHC
jgi:hypothetical protein